MVPTMPLKPCTECGNRVVHMSDCHQNPDNKLRKESITVTQVLTPAEVDFMLDTYLTPEDEVLQEIRQRTASAGLPAIEVSAQQGKMLELLARTAKAKNVLEIGTLAGYSTVCLARAVGPEGSVTSLEFEPRHAEIAREHIALAGMAWRAGVVIGPALDTLATLHHSLGAVFDFIFIDADKENNLAYTQWALTVGTEDVTIVVDNVIRDGRVLARDRPEKLEYIAFLGNHPELDVSVVQTVGSKGWDGFVLAKRKLA